MNINDFDTKVIKYYKVTADYVREERKKFKRVRKGFIKYLAYEGYFDNLLDKREIKAAKKGSLPPYLDIHHMIPLSGGGSSSFDNLVVITKPTHKFINKNYFQPQLSQHIYDEYGSVYEIKIPIFNTYVDSGRIQNYKKELLRTKQINLEK